MPPAALRMDAQSINPFIECVGNVFETMLNIRPARQGLEFSRGARLVSGLSAIVGISGAATGVVALRFEEATALGVASIMLAAQKTLVDETVIDAVAEIANMVAGSAKAKLDFDPPPRLGLPSIILGKSYRLSYPSSALWVQAPFKCELGDFSMELTFDEG